MKFRGGEFSTGTTGNFQSELTLALTRSEREDISRGSLPVLRFVLLPKVCSARRRR
jgi:hypothetical protein